MTSLNSQRSRYIKEILPSSRVLQDNGVKLRNNGAKNEQIHCPFHGPDNKPSARYYQRTTSDFDGVFCFFCREHWNCIDLFKKFVGFEGNFHNLLNEIENHYSLTVPKEFSAIEKPKVSDNVRLLQILDTKLKTARQDIDFDSFVKISTFIDRMYFKVETQPVTYEDTQLFAEKIIKIIEKNSKVGVLPSKWHNIQ